MFYVGRDGAILAELVYSKPADNKMIIEHTEVDDSLAGKGVGLQLVHTAVEYARTHQMKIIPLALLQNLYLIRRRSTAMCWRDQFPVLGS